MVELTPGQARAKTRPRTELGENDANNNQSSASEAPSKASAASGTEALRARVLGCAWLAEGAVLGLMSGSQVERAVEYVLQAARVSESHGGVAAEQAVSEPAAGQPSAAAEALPDGWGSAWDETAQAYYYYSSAGQTQWEVPSVHGAAGALGQYQATQPPAATPTRNAWDDPSLPPELRRELKRQAQRGGGGELQSFVGTAPVVTQQDFWNGEKHQEYTSMASAFHVPMNVCLALRPALAARAIDGAQSHLDRIGGLQHCSSGDLALRS